jgi:hypothetical protein
MRKIETTDNPPAATKQVDSLIEKVSEAVDALNQASVFSRKSHEQWRQAGKAFYEAMLQLDTGELRKTIARGKARIAVRIYLEWEKLTTHPRYCEALGISEIEAILFEEEIFAESYLAFLEQKEHVVDENYMPPF